MAREFIFKGKTFDELKSMDIREFAKYLTSDSRRAVLRQFDKIEKEVEKFRNRQEKGKAIRTQKRNLVVVPKMVDMEIGIHNGKGYFKVKIMPDMLGHRLGEFAPTRGKVQHGAPGIGATRSSAAMSVK